MRQRVVVLCPGRGSYTAGQLGSLAGLEEDPRGAPLREWLERVDAQRREDGMPTIRELDGAEKFSSRLLQADNAAPLIFAVTARDLSRLDPERVEIVAVGGNSMGWYSALYAGGALTLPDAGRLIATMALATGGGEGGAGGQVIYPAMDEEWRVDALRAMAVGLALSRAEAAGHWVGSSIDFGRYHVLWADDEGVRFLMRELPPLRLGRQEYPLQLFGNAAFHSPLMQGASEIGLAELAGLGWGPPAVAMIDGRGAQWRPLTTDPEDLIEYTLGTQVVETFDFTATVRVALREYAPDRIVLLGPGESLGSAVAQVLISEGWHGIDSRSAFLAAQQEDPFVISMARPEQASLVC